MELPSERPLPFTEQHPAFRVRNWRELLGEKQTASAMDMARHYLITGETGSGKSRSAVMPLLESVLRYPEQDLYQQYRSRPLGRWERRDQLRPAVLVVDPKQELHEVVNREADGRRVTTLQYGRPSQALYFFEGTDTQRLGANDAVQSILQQSEFYTRDLANTREPCWALQAGNLIKDFVAVDMYLAAKGKEKVVALWDAVRHEMSKHRDYVSIANVFAYNRNNYFKPMATLVAMSVAEDSNYPMSVYLDACMEHGVPGEMLARLITINSLSQVTRSSVVWMANGVLSDIAADELASCISLNPIEPPEESFSVQTMLNRGDVLIYIPTVSASSIADTVGRCIKAKFLQFVFVRPNKVRPFAYIVDEAHRFITAGDQDGEQSLLDRCRAFRTIVVLSTQSIASMRFKLEGGLGFGSTALEIMLNNCGNALYFRTSDLSTQHSVRSRIPESPVLNRPHVASVRPLTSLSTGSCYALRSNGSWGIFQVKLSETA